MKIALPTVNGELCMHFGHCEKFIIFEINEENIISDSSEHTPPPHEPGVLPAWLAEMSVNTIIAGGMGQRAQALFTQNNISVVTGAPAMEATAVVQAYLNNSLETGANACDH